MRLTEQIRNIHQQDVIQGILSTRIGTNGMLHIRVHHLPLILHIFSFGVCSSDTRLNCALRVWLDEALICGHHEKMSLFVAVGALEGSSRG